VTAELAIRVRALTRRFGGFVAVNEVTFDVARGEIFGYLGANGAGKSTTIRILCGLLSATSGEATVGGVDVMRDPSGVRRAIGYMSQKFSLYPDLTVSENLTFFGGAYGLFGKAFRARRAAVEAELDLGQMEDRLVGALPGGSKQRVALACAILHQPGIVFLDEPTAGVDPESRRSFWGLIRRLAHAGTTIFVTTHYLDEAEYCDRLGLMSAGRLAALGTPDELRGSLVVGRMLEVRGATLEAVQGLDSVKLLEVEPFGAALHVRVAREGPEPAALQRALAAAGQARAQVSEIPVTLEDVFLTVERAAIARGAP
jgi:ABC-2 type transport system ATP-binding protein